MQRLGEQADQCRVPGTSVEDDRGPQVNHETRPLIPFQTFEVGDFEVVERLIIDNAGTIEHGLVIVDTHLLLGATLVNLVGVDSNGALTLIVLGTSADDAIMQRAAEAHAWCLKHPDVISRLYRDARTPVEWSPRVFLVAEQLPESFLQKVKQLPIAEVDCVRFLPLQGGGASGVYFETLEQWRSAPPRRTRVERPGGISGLSETLIDPARSSQPSTRLATPQSSQTTERASETASRSGPEQPQAHPALRDERDTDAAPRPEEPPSSDPIVVVSAPVSNQEPDEDKTAARRYLFAKTIKPFGADTRSDAQRATRVPPPSTYLYAQTITLSPSEAPPTPQAMPPRAPAAPESGLRAQPQSLAVAVALSNSEELAETPSETRPTATLTEVFAYPDKAEAQSQELTQTFTQSEDSDRREVLTDAADAPTFSTILLGLEGFREGWQDALAQQFDDAPSIAARAVPSQASLGPPAQGEAAAQPDDESSPGSRERWKKLLHEVGGLHLPEGTELNPAWKSFLNELEAKNLERQRHLMSLRREEKTMTPDRGRAQSTSSASRPLPTKPATAKGLLSNAVIASKA